MNLHGNLVFVFDNLQFVKVVNTLLVTYLYLMLMLCVDGQVINCTVVWDSDMVYVYGN